MIGNSVHPHSSVRRFFRRVGGHPGVVCFNSLPLTRNRPQQLVLFTAALLVVFCVGRSVAQTGVTTSNQRPIYVPFFSTDSDIEASILRQDSGGFGGLMTVEGHLTPMLGITTYGTVQATGGFETIIVGDGINGAPWYGFGQTNLDLGFGLGATATQVGGYSGLNFQTANGQMVMRPDSGNVGINTTTPGEKLEVNGNIRASGLKLSTGGALTFGDGSSQSTAYNPSLGVSTTSLHTSYYAEQSEAVGLSLDNQYGGGNGSVSILFQNQGHPAAKIQAFQSYQVNNPQGDLSFQTSNGSNLFEVMRLLHNGNTGIGTSTPSEKLEVNGRIKLTPGPQGGIIFGDDTQQLTAWTGVIPSTMNGGDFAESVDVTGPRSSYEAGDLLVIDAEHPGSFLKSSKPYSTLVGGVYATKPGMTGRRQPKEKPQDGEVPMAMVGIVPTKVSSENGPIKVGDLLVSSSRVGYAMKGTDRVLMIGATVGKALAPLAAGEGTIEVLISLQ